ncbi:putative RNA-directed DNA polymerase from transposon BS [Trichonephila clavipes]|nr:putative RNA-directed DNA polymerase from transposon BS [Trichonephila clavipes]GFX23045.1 putative RNA-directed DNA polymerase from transposon BS [Trichonephila clavipes]
MLFSLYVAGIEKIIPGESDIGMFADDITLWCSSPGREWGADAQTLRTTDIALIRPILEYGFPVYFCASPSNLLQLERVQLSAARIITGLRNSCPNDVVLYDANLAPLSLVRNSNLVKYYNKLNSYENRIEPPNTYVNGKTTRD